MSRLLLALLLLSQDPDRDTLLKQLGDPSPAVRDSAMAALEAQGDAAAADLRKAASGADPEIRARAESILFRLEQRAWIGALKDAQRPKKLHRPFPEKTPDGIVAETEGVRFAFTRDAWSPEGKVLGTRFITAMQPAADVDVTWTVAAVRNGADLPLETCGYHSPGIVYVPGEPPSTAQVVVRGRRRWMCDVPVDFVLPADGDSKRIGDYVVTVRWPELIVKSIDPVPERVLFKVLRDDDVQATLKPGRERKDHTFGGRTTLVCRSACGGGVRAPLAWCGCVGQPSPAMPEPEDRAQETVARERWYSKYDLDDIASIRVTFHLPVEELFEVTSPPLK